MFMVLKFARRTCKLLKKAVGKKFGTITHVDTQKKVIALTFDDGPHPAFTPKLLDILKGHGSKATFFMVGRVAQDHPELVRRVADDGHVIANHSWDHKSLPLLNRRERIHQVLAGARSIAPYGTRLFRPPYGHQSVASHIDILLLGYQVVTWNVVGWDWLDYDSGYISDRIISQVKPGSIVLLHDGMYSAIDERYVDRKQTLKAVDAVLDRLGQKFQFVTLVELFRHGPKIQENWYKRPNVQWLKGLRQTDYQTSQQE
jgi:peptidoglycan/xylan/chitin deacetylase (PgdA/CDA1 family)